MAIGPHDPHPSVDVPNEPRNRRVERVERVEHVENKPQDGRRDIGRSNSPRARPFKIRPIYKYALVGLCLLAIANAYLVPSLMFLGGKLLWNRAGAHQSVVDKQLDNLNSVWETVHDKGLEGYESFIDTLKDQQRKVDEHFHPEKKSWTSQVENQYHQAMNKLADWNCKAEEKIHELRYGKSTIPYSCDAKSFLRKSYDKVAGAAGAVAGAAGVVKEHIPGLRHKSLSESASDAVESAKSGAKDAASVAADKAAAGLDDLEAKFMKARDEGQEELRSLADQIKEQRAKLERMYDETLERASSVGDASSDKAKEWKDHFKQQAGDSLRSFREMSDEFEQKIQDFLGTDKSRWGFFNRLKFW